MAIPWKDLYKVGHEVIDAEHQELFSKANVFLSATDKASLTAGAMELYKYTREHFGHEESLMREITYPATEAHIQQHNDLIRRLNEIAVNIAGNQLDHKELEDFLSDWLLVHIRVYDTKLAAHLVNAAR